MKTVERMFYVTLIFGFFVWQPDALVLLPFLLIALVCWLIFR